MVKVVRYLPKSEAAFHRKRLIHEYLFLLELQDYSLKKRLHQRYFPVSLSNIAELFFCETRLGGDCFC